MSDCDDLTLTDLMVHATAVVDEGACIGAGSRIWHFAHVMPGARIGSGCVVGQGCYIANVTIGDNVRIQNNVSVYDGVTLEDDVFCGPSCVFTNVINPRAEVERKNEYKPTLVRKGASIGANATILCGVTIGRYGFVGAGATVTKDVRDHEIVHGVPATHHGWMCACGRIFADVGDTPRDTELSCTDCDRRYVASPDGLAVIS